MFALMFTNIVPFYILQRPITVFVNSASDGVCAYRHLVSYFSKENSRSNCVNYPYMIPIVIHQSIGGNTR